MPLQTVIDLSCGRFELDTLTHEGGRIVSNLHTDRVSWARDHATGDWDAYHRYEGAIDALESFILAASLAGINVEDKVFHNALETTLASIGNQQ